MTNANFQKPKHFIVSVVALCSVVTRVSLTRMIPSSLLINNSTVTNNQYQRAIQNDRSGRQEPQLWMNLSKAAYYKDPNRCRFREEGRKCFI